MNNLALIGNTQVTMTSLELVEFINSQRGDGEYELLHKNFVAKVPQVLGEETSAKFLADLPDSYGRSRRGYRFPKREACLMAMSYSYDLQAKVFDRMSELEARSVQPFAIPQTLPEALRLAADLSEQKAVVEAELAIAAPKADALDRIATGTDGSMCITDTAKHLQMQPKALFSWLSANGWIYRRAGGKAWIAYQYRLQSGFLEHKIITVERSDGSSKMVENVLVTPKGLARLAELLQSEAA